MRIFISYSPHESEEVRLLVGTVMSIIPCQNADGSYTPIRCITKESGKIEITNETLN